MALAQLTKRLKTYLQRDITLSVGQLLIVIVYPLIPFIGFTALHKLRISWWIQFPSFIVVLFILQYVFARLGSTPEQERQEESLQCQGLD